MAIDAPPDDPSPDLFHPWLNIWHPDDCLSYPAGAMFGNVPDVCDRHAQQGGVFPFVHLHYLTGESKVFDSALRDPDPLPDRRPVVSRVLPRPLGTQRYA